MRRVGTAVRTAQGLVVVRSPDDSVPDIGETVIDEALDTVGRVVDVFGPVSRPYVAVTPETDRSLATLLNERLYVR